MRIVKYLIVIMIVGISISACSQSKPSSSLKEDQYEIINQNIKKAIGTDYSAIDFIVLEEGFSNQEETKYIVKFVFNLNKPYMMFEGKRIPGELQYSINENKDWICTYNSIGSGLSILNLFR